MKIRPEFLEKFRSDFEAWSLLDGNYPDGNYATVKMQDGSIKYISYPTDSRFKIWCASRQTVRIPLPENLIWQLDGDDCMDVSTIESAIESAGYKCEGVGGD